MSTFEIDEARLPGVLAWAETSFEKDFDCIRRIDAAEVSCEPDAWYPWLVVRYD